MAEQLKWHTDDPNVFLIGGRRINIAKKGREQAVQIEQLNKWLKEHIAPLSEAMKGQDANDPGAALSMLGSMELTADAQMELAGILVGSKDTDGKALEPGFLDEFYDFEWVVDALSKVGRGGPMQRLLTAFFTSAG